MVLYKFSLEFLQMDSTQRERESSLEHLAVFWFSMYGVRGIQCSSIDVAHWAVISLVCYEADPAVLAMLTALWGRGEWASHPSI